MADLGVDPAYLAELAKKLESSLENAQSATTATNEVPPELWLSHGVLSGASNDAVKKAEEARRSAGAAIQAATQALANRLTASRIAYEAADRVAGESLDTQMKGG